MADEKYMKYTESGAIVSIDATCTDEPHFVIRLSGSYLHRVVRCKATDLQREHLALGDDIVIGWEPVARAEPNIVTGSVVPEILREEAVASLRRAWLTTAIFAVTSNLCWAAIWYFWR